MKVVPWYRFWYPWVPRQAPDTRLGTARHLAGWRPPDTRLAVAGKFWRVLACFWALAGACPTPGAYAGAWRWNGCAENPCGIGATRVLSGWRPTPGARHLALAGGRGLAGDCSTPDAWLGGSCAENPCGRSATRVLSGWRLPDTWLAGGGTRHKTLQNVTLLLGTARHPTPSGGTVVLKTLGQICPKVLSPGACPTPGWRRCPWAPKVVPRDHFHQLALFNLVNLTP